MPDRGRGTTSAFLSTFVLSTTRCRSSLTSRSSKATGTSIRAGWTSVSGLYRTCSIKGTMNVIAGGGVRNGQSGKVNGNWPRCPGNLRDRAGRTAEPGNNRRSRSRMSGTTIRFRSRTHIAGYKTRRRSRTRPTTSTKKAIKNRNAENGGTPTTSRRGSQDSITSATGWSRPRTRSRISPPGR